MSEIWRQICELVPSKHIAGRQAQTPLGFRYGLATWAAMIQPLRYLEIGTRQGHSLALVALIAGSRLELATSIDLYIENYGGEPNGLEITEATLERCGVIAGELLECGPVEMWQGNSHAILPHFIEELRRYNLILVDGDHTESGAREDLDHAWELLEPGGVMIFDDCVNGSEGDLETVWRIWFAEHRGGCMAYGISEELEHRDVPAWAWCQRRDQ